ncbi:extracellular solute-binding protein [Brevibacillus sp. NRS-1366]|uniref:extracellular solute-binding protein n=1 Tax=Brevibacillus sp. NRS-1366 TaxID=3233899 RepID=UPI003D21E666
MTIWKKSTAVLLTAMMSTSLLVGCGATSNSTGNVAAGNTNATSTSTEPVEINFHYGGSLNVKNLWEKLIPMFEGKNPGIKVKQTYLPPGQAASPIVDRLVAAKKSGQSSVDIDLFEGGLGEITAGEKEGIWEKLSDTQVPNLSKVDQKFLEQIHYKGVPYRASSVVLAYNSEKVANPPKSADELYDWIRQNPGRFAYNDPATGGSGNSFVVTAIYNFLEPDAITSNDPAVMKEWDKGFALLKELGPYMYGKGIYPKKNQGTLDLLASGEVDMIPAWSDMALEQINKKLLPETTKLAQIEPSFTGGPAYMLVPAMSAKKEATQKFLDFLLTPEAQEVVVNTMYGYPGIKWAEMPSSMQEQFASVAKGYRQFSGGDLEKEMNKRWQKEVAGSK